MKQMEKAYLKNLAFSVIAVGLLFGGAFYFEKSNDIGRLFPGVGDVAAETAQQIAPDDVINTLFGKPAAQEELKKEDLVIGSGVEAKDGDTVKVHYLGTLIDGKKFDSSYDRGEPIEFTIGSGQLIKGWELGIPSMKVGGKRKLMIPPSLGYGPSGRGDIIPLNATLLFEVELVEVGRK